MSFKSKLGFRESMMSSSRTCRGVGVAFGLMTVVIGGCFLAVYGVSEWRLSRRFEAPLVPLRPPSEPDLVEGERMARIVGCWDGCHGQRGEGGHEEIDGIVRHTAPTLSQVVVQYSDDELVRLIRYGVKRDKRTAVGMTSYTLWALGDQDLANIITHLRRQPVLPPVERALQLTWRGRVALVTGTWKVSAEQVDRSRPQWGNLPQTTPFERGRYLASVTCSECHGLDYRGNDLEGAPSLAIIGAYSEKQFLELMRTARPIGGRELNENMTWVANAPFTDAEIAGLYQFLRTFHGFRP
jgi:cytochrome c553